MNRRQKRLLTYGVLFALAAVIVLMVVSFELSSWEAGSVTTAKCLSDGFFTAAVLYLGCGLLVFIQEAGNFYGIQFLFYTMVHLFSFRRDGAENRKTYFAYCQDKMERQAAEGKSPVKTALLLVGLLCLILSVLFMAVFYRT